MAENTGTKLVPLKELYPFQVGARLHSLIYGGRGGTPDPWVAEDFPRMVRSYATADRAEARVCELIKIAEDSGGERGFLAVMQGETMVGMATFGQERLETHKGYWPFRKTAVHADGPLLACWLARREQRIRPFSAMLPLVLRQMAVYLASNSTVHGRPWTLVRANRNDDSHVDRCLTDVNNGFGGFEPVERGVYPQVDGVTVERTLYMGRHPVETFQG